MGKVINLNRFRKEKARRDRTKQADANRVRSGLTQEERALEVRRQQLRERKIDGHKLEGDPGTLEPDDG
ncbi:MAG TPA: DUF4169 family protein [Polyangiales bacterium]|jgi:hypothetical protein